MITIKNNHLRKYLDQINNNFGLFFFHLGILFLFSAPSIAAVFILSSLFTNKNLKYKKLYKNFTNYPLFIASVLMLMSCLFFPLSINEDSVLLNYDLFTKPYIGLLNWIPFFIFFSRIESYLDDVNLRIYTCFFLICSVVPVFISGFSQEFLNIYGPNELFNGLIIWYQRPNMSGMTGLFNNQNYAGTILGSLLPIAVYFFYDSRNKIIKRMPTFIILISCIIGIFLTNSRNALLSIPIVFGFLIFNKLKKIKLLFFVNVFLIIVIFNIFPVANKFSENLQLSNIVKDPRIQIYSDSISYIIQRPFLGWGGNGFSSIWNLDQSKDNFFTHSHNIFLEFSIQYGLIASLLVSSLVIYMIYESFKKLYIDSSNKNYNNLYFDKAWFTSGIIIITSNLLDITYYDFRVSALFWILMVGIKVISMDKSLT